MKMTPRYLDFWDRGFRVRCGSLLVPVSMGQAAAYRDLLERAPETDPFFSTLRRTAEHNKLAAALSGVSAFLGIRSHLL